MMMHPQTPDFWLGKAFFSLDAYLKQTFGEKVYRISLNGGMSCPNRDGTKGTRGCIFCSRGGSGDFAGAATLPISEQLRLGKAALRAKSDCHKYIAYFQAYSNTYAPVSYLRPLFEEAISDPEVVVLSIATRPDCLNDDIYALLAELNTRKPVWIEFGLQTIQESTAALIRREFSLSCYEAQVKKLQALHIPVISHLILGLPGETKAQMLQSVDYIAHSGISGVKLQLLHVLNHTDLADLYQQNPFPIFTLEDYCDFIVDCVERLPQDMVIHRITGDGPRSLLLEPKWSTDKKRVLNTIQKRFRERNTWQGKFYRRNEKNG